MLGINSTLDGGRQGTEAEEAISMKAVYVITFVRGKSKNSLCMSRNNHSKHTIVNVRHQSRCAPLCYINGGVAQ